MPTFQKDIFRDRLKFLRKQKKLTQDGASKKFGVSRTCYSSWELGQSCPPMDDLFNLCVYFVVSADYLLGLSDSISPAAVTPVSIAPVSIPRSDTNPLEELDPDLRNKAEGYIDSLLEQQRDRSLENKKEEKA